MKPWLLLTFGLLTYLAYGLYLSQTDLVVIPTNLKREQPTDFYDYRGVTNIRTNLSNGSAPTAQVIAEAKQAGLDFLIITDLNQFQNQPHSASYYGNLVVLNGGEYSFLDSRLLTYPQKENLTFENSAEANVYFTDLLSSKFSEKKNSLVILGEPFRNNNPTWVGAYPPGLDGIEIVNPKSISANAWIRSKLNVLWSFFVYPFNPRYAFLRLFREPTAEVALWDQLSQERPTLAFSGADASARAIPWANMLVEFPSYQKSFEITSNHILLNSELTGNFPKDSQKIWQALKSGHFYLSLDLLGDPKGFICQIDDLNKSYLMGDQINYSKNLKLHCKLPIEPRDFYELVVLKNGQRELTINSPEFTFPITEPGTYRVIVRVSPQLPIPDGKKWITWIYTNNFYIQKF